MGRLLLFLLILALLWTLFRAFIRYLSSSNELARSSGEVDPDRVDWYRRNGYREWVRYRIGYTLHTRAAGSRSGGETVIEERDSFSPWFLAGSDEAQRWLSEQNRKPSEEGVPWSERWISGRGIRGDERSWLPPGQQPR